MTAIPDDVLEGLQQQTRQLEAEHAARQAARLEILDGGRGSAWDQQPEAKPAKAPKPKKRKPAKLSLIRRMACFDHCVAALVDMERNTLRRMVRLRAAVEALGLKGAIRDPEMAEAVMQAIDRRNGNIYELISGE